MSKPGRPAAAGQGCESECAGGWRFLRSAAGERGRFLRTQSITKKGGETHTKPTDDDEDESEEDNGHEKQTKKIRRKIEQQKKKKKKEEEEEE